MGCASLISEGGELSDFLLVQQKASIPKWHMEFVAGLLEGANVALIEPRLTAINPDKGIPDVDFSGAYRLHLGSFQFDSCFEFFRKYGSRVALFCWVAISLIDWPHFWAVEPSPDSCLAARIVAEEKKQENSVTHPQKEAISREFPPPRNSEIKPPVPLSRHWGPPSL